MVRFRPPEKHPGKRVKNGGAERQHTTNDNVQERVKIRSQWHGGRKLFTIQVDFIEHSAHFGPSLPNVLVSLTQKVNQIAWCTSMSNIPVFHEEGFFLSLSSSVL